MKDYQYKYIVNLAIFLVNHYNMSGDVATWIACQSALETSYGQSNIYKSNLNLFGMKVAKKRFSVRCSEKYGHAQYLSVADSVNDYMLWFVFVGFHYIHFRSLSDFLGRFASTSFNPKMDSYIETVNSIYRSFNSYIDGKEKID